MDPEFEAIDDSPVSDDAIEDLEADNLDAFEAEEIGDVEQDDQSDGEEEALEGEDLSEEEPEPDQMVVMESGEQIPLSELQAGYMKGKAFTQKTEELAEDRRVVAQERDTLQQRGQQVEATFTGLIEFMQGLIPAEPSIELLRSDPNQYQFEVAMRNRALSELEQVAQAKQGFDAQKQGFSEQDQETFRQQEETKLIKAMPHLKDAVKRQAFDAANAKTAAEFGFSEAEIQATADSRILQLVHYARLGKTAEQNRAAARRRVQNPQKGSKTQKANPAAVKSGNSAMERLQQTGSLEDAVRALGG